MWCWIRKRRGGIHYNMSVVSRIHGHRGDLAHARCWSRGWRLRGPSAYQVVERRSALNECVKSFLDTRVVKIDTWCGAGRSLTTWCHWQTAWRAAITLWCSWRTSHGRAGCVLGRRWAKGAIGLWLGSSRGRATSTYWSSAAVEQAEDFSLKLLLMVGVSRGAWSGWQTEVSGLWGCVSRMGWRRQSCSWGRNIMVYCCWSCNMNCGCRAIGSVRICYNANNTAISNTVFKREKSMAIIQINFKLNNF